MHNILAIWRTMPLSERIGAIVIGPAVWLLAIGIALVIGE